MSCMIPEDQHLTGETAEEAYGNAGNLGQAHFPVRLLTLLIPTGMTRAVAPTPQDMVMRIHQGLLELSPECCFSAPRLLPSVLSSIPVQLQCLMLDFLRQWGNELKADATSPACG